MSHGHLSAEKKVSHAGITAHNRILNDGTSTYTYDAEGNRTSKTDIATGSKVEYQWNHANLLTGVIYKTSNNVVTKSVAYQYDALGRRIGKSVDDNGNGTVDRRESYLYDGAGLLSSFAPSGGEGGRRPDEGATSAIHISGPNGSLGQHGWTDQMILSFVDADGDGSGTSQLSGRYLYGPAVDEVFAMENGTGDVLWSLTDQLGTPRDWAQRTSSGNTVIAQHIRYTTFGAIDSTTDASGNPLASSLQPQASFTGQLTDPDAGLIYYRARWYDPQLGKFISDDPMGFEAEDANVSRYVGNGTQRSIDPTGLLGSSKSGGNGSPLPPFNQIGAGFPTTLPPTGSVSVIVGQRDFHTFILLLNRNGQITFVTGQPNH